MNRFGVIGAAMLVLAGCASSVPDSGQGVGFDDYSRYELERAQREAGVNAGLAPSGQIAAGGILPGAAPVTTAAIPSSDLAAAGIGATPQPFPSNATTLPLPAGANATQAPAGLYNGNNANATISDEQDFDAVAGRETIASDAERRAQQAAQFEVIQPTALPTRTGDTGPNIVEYAISAPNRKGQEWYSRLRLSGEGRFQRNCAKYRTPDEAQRDFLSRGGPDRDTMGIDPDGDGFACGWDPAPFIAAVRG